MSADERRRAAGASMSAASLPPAARTVVAPERVIASTLDSLVRATRARGTSLDDIGGRLLLAWRYLPDKPLTFEAGGLMVGGRSVLQATDTGGRWLLPAFMSGLRTLRLRPTATHDDVVRLASELSALEIEACSIRRFQDWLWADGAEGFDVELHASFVETADALGAPDVVSTIAAVRGAVTGGSAEDSVLISAAELDVAATREELEVPLDLFATEGARRPEVTALDFAALSREADDPSSWLAAEVTSAHEVKGLRELLPPGRLARRVAERLRTGVSPASVALVTALAAAGESGLEDAGIGVIIARALDVTDAPARASVTELFRVASDLLVRQLARGFAQRAAADRAALPSLISIAVVAGVERFVSAAVAERPTDGPAAEGALQIAVGSGRVGAELLSTVLQAAPDASLASLFSTLPPPALADLGMEVESAARRLPQAERLAFVTMLVARRSGIAPSAGWALLKGVAIDDDDMPALDRLVTATVEREIEALVVVARGLKYDLRARVAAVNACAAQPRVGARATSFSVRELFDPPEVRAALKAARARTKGR